MNQFDSSKRVFTFFGALLLVGCTAADDVASHVDATESSLGEPSAQGPGSEVPVEERLFQDAVPEKTSVPSESRVVLPYVWQGQPNGYWCGPGATRIALTTRMENPPSQATLAASMGTKTDGTAHIGLPVKELNRYLSPERPYVARMVDWVATPEQTAQLKTDLVTRIGSGHPIIANVISGWRPPGYPSGRIYHYVAVVGYDADGDMALIADPAAEGSAGPRWENVPRTYWISTANLARWIGGKGYSS